MQVPPILNVHGIRVLTTRQLACMYDTKPEIINNNFIRNKTKYVLEKHYISVSGEEMRQLKTSHQFDGELKRVSRAYFWTEKGALLHAKSLNTDKAWEVYAYLVDFYFRAKGKGQKITPSASVEKPAKLAEKEPFDIAPLFRELITYLPLDALDAMEKSFRQGTGKASRLAGMSILAEKMKRQMI